MGWGPMRPWRWLAALGLALALGGGRAAADPCGAAGLRAVARGAACLLSLEAKEARRGIPPDAAKAERCREKLADALDRAEAKPSCASAGRAPGVAAELDAFVAALDGDLSVAIPNQCQARKLRAARKAARCRLHLEAKAEKRDAPVPEGKLERCRSRLDAAFARAERRPPCATSGDAPAIAAAIDAFVASLRAGLAGGTGSLDSWSYVEIASDHEQTFALAFGDLDGDGDTDVVSGRYWYANPGGDMTGAWSRSPAFPGDVHAMLVEDVDGDALADVIAQGQSGTEVSWLEATDATATAWSAVPVGTLPASSHGLGMQGYRSAQLEAGGRPELVFSSGGGIHYFRIPAASPEAGSWPSVRVHVNPSDEGFGVGDIDADGDLDVAAGTGDTGRAEWYRNPGDGSPDWAALPLGDVSDFVYPDRFEVADLSGDGRPDVVGTEENGAASGARTVWWAQPEDPAAPDWPRAEIATQGSTNSLAVADMDDDGDPDVVTGEHRGGLALAVFENDGTGSAFVRHAVGEGHENHLGARPVDLDGDGDLDLVGIAYDAPQYVHLWRNDAAPTVPFRHVVVDPDLPGYLDCKAVGDVDGDGLPDVIIGTDTQLVWYAAPDWAQHPIAAGANFTTDMQAADVDADGDLDVVVPEYDIGRVAWYRNPRIGGGPWAAVPIGTGVTAHDLELADVDGDGRIDVAIRGHFGPTTLFLQGADPATWTPVPVGAAIASEGLALADVDGDGLVDIVQNGYWLEAPDDPGVGAAWVRHSFDDAWEADTVGAAVADLSGDGRPDVVLAFAESPGHMAWYEAPADPRIGADWTPHPIADGVDYVHTFKLADVDGDGALDVVFAEMAQSEQKRVGFFRNGGDGLSWTLQVLSTQGSHNVRVTDLGADGDADIVGANWQGAPVELWENLTVP